MSTCVCVHVYVCIHKGKGVEREGLALVFMKDLKLDPVFKG